VTSSNHALIATDFLEETEEYGGAVPYLKSQVTQPVNNSDYGRMDCNAVHTYLSKQTFRRNMLPPSTGSH
jgi:hypothetical protein